MKNPKPSPVVVRTLCSLCDQEWDSHGPNPTTADCIRLLKAELATRPSPYLRPFYPQPWWYGSTTYTINADRIATSGTATVTYLTPRDDDGPEAVGAVA